MNNHKPHGPHIQFNLRSLKDFSEDENYQLNFYLFETMKVSKGSLLDFPSHWHRLCRSFQLLFPHSAILLDKNFDVSGVQFFHDLQRTILREGTLETYRLKLSLTPLNLWGEMTPLYPHPLLGTESNHQNAHHNAHPQIQFCLEENTYLDLEEIIFGMKSKVYYQHKFAHRPLYQNFSLRPVPSSDLYTTHNSVTVPIFQNSRGELTETATANIFFYDREFGGFITPPVESGLLPGIERNKILTRGLINWDGKEIPVKEQIVKSEWYKKQHGGKIPMLMTNSLIGILKNNEKIQ